MKIIRTAGFSGEPHRTQGFEGKKFRYQVTDQQGNPVGWVNADSDGEAQAMLQPGQRLKHRFNGDPSNGGYWPKPDQTF